MGSKYEFTNETMQYDGVTLHRIRRLSDNKPGGWIEKEENLSQTSKCWVDDNAMVYGNARVAGEAKVSEDAQVYDNAIVYGCVCVYGQAKVYGSAKVYGHAEVYGNTEVEHAAQIYDEAKVYGNAKIRGVTKVYEEAKVYGNAEVFDMAHVYGNAQVYDNAKVKWSANVYGKAHVRGNAEVNYEFSSGIIGEESINKLTDENTDALKDFIYKIDESSKLDIQSNYDSVDAFFEDISTESYSEHECLTIVAIDTKVPIMKLEKAQVKE